jgi:hypothetical protein
MPDGDVRITEDDAPSSQYAPSQYIIHGLKKYIIHGVSNISSLVYSFGSGVQFAMKSGRTCDLKAVLAVNSTAY